MKKTGNKIKNLLKIGLLTFFVSSFLIGGISYGANDLLRQLFDPAINSENVIDMGENVNTVGHEFFDGSIDITILDIESIRKIVKTDDNGNLLCDGSEDTEVICPQECQYISENNKETCNRVKKRDAGGGITKSPSIIVKVTRLLLILVITLSVTMILWNGMSYIIQTGQGKEGKNLVKNIIYIVVGILISLFSVVIITIIQSVPETIDQEVKQETNNKTDNKAVGEKETIITESGKKLGRGSYKE